MNEQTRRELTAKFALADRKVEKMRSEMKVLDDMEDRIRSLISGADAAVVEAKQSGCRDCAKYQRAARQMAEGVAELFEKKAELQKDVAKAIDLIGSLEAEIKALTKYNGELSDRNTVLERQLVTLREGSLS